MATSAYMAGRKRYQRPEAVLWSNNSGTLTGGLYLPNGYEVGAVVPSGTDEDLIDQFLILSDNNRGEINFNQQRIEKRERTINGRMRSYHIADKLNISWDWDMLPSRSYSGNPSFNSSGIPVGGLTEYTADGGAGGVDIVKWYESHSGSFYMFMSYDRHDKFADQIDEYNHLHQYNDVIEVYFSSFSFNIVKRGGSNHDFWNISVSVEEV